MKFAQSADVRAEQVAAESRLEIERLHLEVERAKLSAKEEEEKRVKAISLLKTVRQKLVKAEKEKEDTTKELASVRERESSERDRAHAERTRLQGEIDTVNAEREKAITGLRAQFDKEVTNIRERHEKEIFTQRDKHEAESASMKVFACILKTFTCINQPCSRMRILSTSPHIFRRYLRSRLH